MVTVSVIVPIYNMERYLVRCIESLLGQSIRNIEIILVNDGSKDKSLDICTRMAHENPGIVKVIDKPNGGLSSARNAGLKVAEGEFVCFIDPDDYVELTFIEKLYTAIIRDKSDVAVCGVCVEYVNRQYTVKEFIDSPGLFKELEIKQAILQLDDVGIFNYAWNKMYRKNILSSKNIVFDADGVPGEDLLFNCKVFQNITRVTLVKECLYHYMRRDVASLVNTYKSNLYCKVTIFNKARESLYDFWGINSDIGKRCYARHYCEYILPCIFNLYRPNASIHFRERTMLIQQIISDDKFIAYMKIYKPKNALYRGYMLICRIKNPFAQNIIFSILFFLRYKFSGKYAWIREKVEKDRGYV